MDRYPRSSAHDPTWLLDNLTGPNPPPHLLPTFADLLSNGFHSAAWWRDHLGPLHRRRRDLCRRPRRA